MQQVINNFEQRKRFLENHHPGTLVDVFERPDDNDRINIHVAVGDYMASMADKMLFSGRVIDLLTLMCDAF